MVFERLEGLLKQFYIDLVTRAGLEIGPDPQVDTVIVLMALEEMLGVHSGGYALAEPLTEYLSQNKSTRQRITFEKIKSDIERSQKEVYEMVQRDMGY